MSRIRHEPRIYYQEELMRDFNDMQIKIKIHLFNLGNDDYKRRHPRPTVEEMDIIFNRIMSVLKSDSEPGIKR
jgi:hypothetical protein